MVNEGDSRVILEQLVNKLKLQAAELADSSSAFDNGQHYAYYDVLSFMRDQAEILELDPKEIGLNFDIEAMLKAKRQAA